MWTRIACAVALAVSSFASLDARAGDQPPGVPPVPESDHPMPTIAPAMTAEDIDTFFGGFIPYLIETNDIAGLTIAVVKDGQLLFSKGYGFADVEARAPVKPESTMFRIGSVTKLFTWTAVMQQVEQGKLDLDADINTYLDFTVPAPAGRPVTLRDLMTHRGGFEEAIKGLGAQNTGKADLTSYVRNHMPAIVFRPGSTPSYSNYGTALAGYIVEHVTQRPFDAYLEDNIYKPLGMDYTTIRQPVPEALVAHMSKGYALASGPAQDFEIVSGYPAGSQSSSAHDMAKFMLAHLGRGAVGEQRILKESTADFMHNTVTTPDPRVNGIALGFYETSRNGLRIVSHGGDTVFFHSDMHLIPSKNVGFFVSYNSTGRGDSSPRGAIWRKFLDRYYPAAPLNAANAVPGKQAELVAGEYVTTRRVMRGLFKIFTQTSQFTATPQEDGTLVVDGLTGANGQPRVWEPQGDGVFREKHGQDVLVFKKGEDGVMRMLSWTSGVQIMERTTFPENGMFLVSVMAGSIGVLLLAVVGWPLGAALRWHYGVDLGWTRIEMGLRWASLLAALALLIFVLGIIATFAGPLLTSPWVFDGSHDETFRVLQRIGYAGVALTPFALWNALQAWGNETRGFWGRVKETAVALALVGLAWFAWDMNMFDPALKY